MSPTKQLYNAVEMMFNHFNATLFDNALPAVVLTMQKQKRVMGYFSPSSWASNDGRTCHEIAVNPDYIATYPLIEVMQTLVHEQVHCWQTCFGKPSRSGYHNKEWSEKMTSIGLIPSSTGRPGGAKVGQKMADYPENGGLFMQACEALVKGHSFSLPWVTVSGVKPPSTDNLLCDCDSEVAELLVMPVADALGLEPNVQDSQTSRGKTKYTCPKCRANVWGKAELNLKCGDCELPFIALE